MTSGLLPPSPFIAGSMITNPQLFVGRKEELHVITSRMTAVQPVSINVVGKRWSGKSSLLYHLFQAYEQYVQDASRYVVIYLSLQERRYQRETGFYQAVAQELLNLPAVQGQKALTQPLRVKPFNRLAFCAAMGHWKRQKVLPVICLDEIEALLHYPKEFDNGFFDNLRSLMDNGTLMLVVASHRRLESYKRRHQLSSAFFNFGEVLRLAQLREEEAKELVQLPASTVKGTEPMLEIKEQRIARQLGGRHPYLLQLAASLLYEARQQGLDLGWVKTQFAAQARRVQKPLWKLPEFPGDLTTHISGVIMLSLLVVLIIGVLNQTQILEFLNKALGR